MFGKDLSSHLAIDIATHLGELEVAFWEAYSAPGSDEYYEDDDGNHHLNYGREDKITFLYHGTLDLYNKICVFLEIKCLPKYLDFFVTKFKDRLDDPEQVRESRAPLYYDYDEPSMIILDDFRSFLNPFPEFRLNNYFSKKQVDKLLQILENTNVILKWTKTQITNETSIYTPVKHFIEIVFPSSRGAAKGSFTAKFKTYQPDILIPEVSSAVEYKLIRAGQNESTFLDQLKTDADNYVGDSQYKLFYAVVYFEDRGQLNPPAFRQAVLEKAFPDNWIILHM